MASMMVAFFAVLCSLATSVADDFCADGNNAVDGLTSENVVVTWAQAPLNSLNGSQTAKYLHLFHTALVFRQGTGSETRWWTLEFDNAASNLLASFVPTITNDDELVWDVDARWCLRTGIYNNRSHWTTSWDDVVVMSAANFENVIHEWILDYNATVRGAWPQYSFFRIDDYLGNVLMDDMTCGHVYRLLAYARDGLGAQTLLELEALKASRAVIHSATLVPISNESHHATMVSWYKGFTSAINDQAGLVAKLNVIFQAVVPMQFVYDPNLQQYYQIVFALPDVVSLFTIHYEPLGNLPAPPAPSPETCNVSSRCAQVMSEQCKQDGGYMCEACLGVKSSTLIAGTCPLNPTVLMGAVSCYCHGQCGVSDHCWNMMNKVCRPGFGCHLCLTINIADLMLIGGCGPLTSLASQSCFCDASAEAESNLLQGERSFIA